MEAHRGGGSYPEPDSRVRAGHEGEEKPQWERREATREPKVVRV